MSDVELGQRKMTILWIILNAYSSITIIHRCMIFVFSFMILDHSAKENGGGWGHLEIRGR
ncbi:hypothetical protein MtrunA17_Chr4g0042911 [Medicago truncatula]|uniref:Transmembrane protein n=1 Tax=Medicago truncatula TaxID=3880 RepID=A0A396I8U7_MEDTR|nr:hypothetical protein MtrunA17_Chr4g0042911 [Medicago truncatula]